MKKQFVVGIIALAVWIALGWWAESKGYIPAPSTAKLYGWR